MAIVPGSVVVALTYLWGSIPWGWLLVMNLTGVDLLGVGSGGIGATAVERELTEVIGERAAKKWGYRIMLADMMKGLVPTMVGLHYGLNLALILAGATIIGHCYSVFLRGRGGKGVATTMGIVVPLFPWIALASFALWFVVKRKLIGKKFPEATAVASLLAGLVLAILVGSFTTVADVTVRWFAVGLFVHMVFAHRSNIGRIIRGARSPEKAR